MNEPSSDQAALEPKFGEWRAHGMLVFVSMAGTALGVVHLSTMGVFIAPLSEAFGWKRANISSALTLVSVFSVFSAVLVGMLIDKLGPRRIGLFGAMAYCTAFALISTVGPSLWHWWALWLLVAVSVQFVKPTVWAAAVASRFTASRALAMAFALSGAGVAYTVNPILANHLLETYGWRMGYVGLAGFWALLVIPLCALFFYGAQDRAKGPVQPKAKPDQSTLPGFGLRESITAPRFHRLAAAVVLLSLAVVGMMVHFVPMATGAGLPKGTAAALAGLAGSCAIIGRLITGFLLDRFPGPLVGAVAFALPIAAAVLMLNSDGSVAICAVAACLIGAALGADTDIAAYLTSRYFGLRHFGGLFGMLIGLLGIATGFGPLLAGAAYDHAGSYAPFLWGSIPVCLLAAVLVGTLGRYPVLPAAPAGPT